MKKKGYLRRFAMFAIPCMLLFIVLFDSGCGKKVELTLEKLAYDKSKNSHIVYLKENKEYAPYLIISSDYNGNVLLLRKELLPDTMPYKEHGVGWAYHEYGSYYEESSIDEYLNAEFYNSLSQCTRDAIIESEIEVTDKESYDKWNYKTHKIMRNVFLLSSVEMGIEGMNYVTVKEGEALKYLKKRMLQIKELIWKMARSFRIGHEHQNLGIHSLW